MTIFETSINLQKKLNKYKDNKALEEVAKKLQPINEVVSSAEQILKVMYLQFNVLKAHNLIELNDTNNNLTQNLNALLGELSKIEIQSWNNSSEYRKLKGTLSGVNVGIENSILAAWKNFIDKGIPLLPEGIQKSQGENEKLSVKFDRLKKKYLSYKSPPEKESELENLIQKLDASSKEMFLLAKQFKTGCPDYMEVFFQNISKDFDLQDLTTDMLDFLIKSGEASRLVIKRKEKSWM